MEEHNAEEHMAEFEHSPEEEMDEEMQYGNHRHHHKKMKKKHHKGNSTMRKENQLPKGEAVELKIWESRFERAKRIVERMESRD